MEMSGADIVRGVVVEREIGEEEATNPRTWRTTTSNELVNHERQTTRMAFSNEEE